MSRSVKILEDEVMRLQHLTQTGNQDFIDEKISDLLGLKTQGALIRSHFQNSNEINAPSKFFFGLEKKNGSETGVLLSDLIEICKRAVIFLWKILQKWV